MMHLVGLQNTVLFLVLTISLIRYNLTVMEMMADWYDAKKKAIESGEMGRFMSEMLELHDGPAN